MGPRAAAGGAGARGGDALGGTAVASAAALLSADPPGELMRDLGLRFHLFATAGWLGGVRQRQPPDGARAPAPAAPAAARAAVAAMLNAVRTAVGFGVVGRALP